MSRMIASVATSGNLLHRAIVVKILLKMEIFSSEAKMARYRAAFMQTATCKITCNALGMRSSC